MADIAGLSTVCIGPVAEKGFVRTNGHVVGLQTRGCFRRPSCLSLTASTVTSCPPSLISVHW